LALQSKFNLAKHNDTGKSGENLAACWLLMGGFQILFKNWRCGRGEIDIIARKLDVLHFIEVKTSRSVSYGFPEERLNLRKWRNLLKSSQYFLFDWPEDVKAQFDIISIIIDNGSVQYHFIEDAFPSILTFEI
jgi:putative endonuclease